VRVQLTDKDRQKMIKELNDELSPFPTKGGYDTICNHLRLLYRTPLSDYQKGLCEEIIYLSKKITKRLAEIKRGG